MCSLYVSFMFTWCWFCCASDWWWELFSSSCSQCFFVIYTFLFSPFLFQFIVAKEKITYRRSQMIQISKIFLTWLVCLSFFPVFLFSFFLVFSFRVTVAIMLDTSIWCKQNSNKHKQFLNVPFRLYRQSRICCAFCITTTATRFYHFAVSFCAWLYCLC